MHEASGYNPEYERRALYGDLQDLFDRHQADVASDVAFGIQTRFLAGMNEVRGSDGTHGHGVTVTVAGHATTVYKIMERCPDHKYPFLHILPVVRATDPFLFSVPLSEKDRRARWLIAHTDFTHVDSLIATAFPAIAY